MLRSFKIKLLLLVAISGSSLQGALTPGTLTPYGDAILTIGIYSLFISAGIGATTGCIQGGLKGSEVRALDCGAVSASCTAIVAMLLVKIITKTGIPEDFEGFKFSIEQNLDDVMKVTFATCLGTSALSYLITHSSTLAVRNLFIKFRNDLLNKSKK